MLALKTRIRLRLDEFDRLTAKRGLHHDKERAHAIGIQPSTITRIRRGETEPSQRFIALALVYLDVAFEALFEIEVDQ